MAQCRRHLVAGALLLALMQGVSTHAQLKKIPSGKFAMGSTDGDMDEAPVRTVTLSPFSILAYEVTEAQYGECVDKGNCTPAHYDDGACLTWDGRRFVKIIVPASARRPDYPVVCVTWQQAKQYCRANGMSLPTEAQWEYSARGGTTQTQSGRCSISRTDGPRKTGSCAPNGYGLYDMTGNAWEWVNDWYDRLAYSEGPAIDPAGPPAGMYRVIRGGGWYSTESQATVTNRQWFSPDFAEVSIGFRCVAP